MQLTFSSILDMLTFEQKNWFIARYEKGMTIEEAISYLENRVGIEASPTLEKDMMASIRGCYIPDH